MTEAPTIRRLTVDDHAALIALWDSAGLPSKPEGRDAKDAFERQLDMPQLCFFGAFVDDVMIGSALATHDGRKGWINRIAVHPDHRRAGLGSRLLRACETWLESCGIGIFACLIEGWNDTSRALVRSNGYAHFEGVAYFTKRSRPDI